MKAWEEVTRLQKILGSIVAVIATIVILWGYGYDSYGHFATKAYADEGDRKTTDELHTYQQQQVISLNRAEIWRTKDKIKQLTRDLTKPALTEGERILINADIAEYNALIICIQEAKDLCY